MSASKQKGTSFETLCIPELRLWYPGAERRALQGALDKGDYILPGEDRFIIEAKNVSRFNLAQWMAEAEVEARNAGVPAGVVLHKRRGNAKPHDQWVTTNLHSFMYISNTVRGNA